MIFRRIFGYVLLSQKIFGRKLKIFENSDYSHWHPIRWFITGSGCQQFSDQLIHTRETCIMTGKYCYWPQNWKYNKVNICVTEMASQGLLWVSVVLVSVPTSLGEKGWGEEREKRWCEVRQTNRKLFCLLGLSAQSVPSQCPVITQSGISANYICQVF